MDLRDGGVQGAAGPLVKSSRPSKSSGNPGDAQHEGLRLGWATGTAVGYGLALMPGWPLPEPGGCPGSFSAKRQSLREREGRI